MRPFATIVVGLLLAVCSWAGTTIEVAEFGALPDDHGALTEPQRAFLDSSVASLAQDGKIECIVLAIFAGCAGMELVFPSSAFTTRKALFTPSSWNPLCQ